MPPLPVGKSSFLGAISKKWERQGVQIADGAIQRERKKRWKIGKEILEMCGVE